MPQDQGLGAAIRSATTLADLVRVLHQVEKFRRLEGRTLRRLATCKMIQAMPPQGEDLEEGVGEDLPLVPLGQVVQGTGWVNGQWCYPHSGRDCTSGWSMTWGAP